MKILLTIFAVLVLGVALMAVVGAFLPKDHVATNRARFKAKPADVFAAVRDFAAQPAWRSGIKKIELLPLREGRVCYREFSRHGAIVYAVIEEQAPTKLVTRIVDEDLPFGGAWTFELSEVAGETELRITERGEVKNVLFRFLARFVFGHTATMDAYLGDLGKKFGAS